MAASSKICAAVVDLSDDECAQTSASIVPASAPGPPARQAKRMPAVAKPLVPAKRRMGMSARSLRYKIDGRCGCLCNCFKPFKDAATFENLRLLHKTLVLMDKPEQDRYVTSSINPIPTAKRYSKRCECFVSMGFHGCLSRSLGSCVAMWRLVEALAVCGCWGLPCATVAFAKCWAWGWAAFLD